MPTVEVFTRARMQAIEDEAIVDARIDIVGSERHLILIRNNGIEIDAGDVRGPAGSTPSLPTIPDELDWNASSDRVYGSAPPGGAGTPTLKLQAGTEVVTTNTEGRIPILFPEAFNGVSSVVAQIGQNTDCFYTHINDVSIGGSAGVSVENINIMTENVSGTAFHITMGTSGGGGGFGAPLPASRLGGCGPVRINWMAFGW